MLTFNFVIGVTEGDLGLFIDVTEGDLGLFIDVTEGDLGLFIDVTEGDLRLVTNVTDIEGRFKLSRDSDIESFVELKKVPSLKLL